MPDTPDTIAIYQETLLEAAKENRQLKARLDALTAAVREAAETLEPYSRDKVLAILGDEP